MKKLRTLGFFSLPPTPRQKQRRVGRPDVSKAACIVFVLCAATAISSFAQTFTTLASFDGALHGASPEAPLVQGLDGDLYGTATYGGLSNNFLGSGTVFKITPGGTLTTLHYFCSQTNCADGANPLAPLVLATNGGLYGTAALSANCPGCGTVFDISAQHQLFTLLHAFSINDGNWPGTGLVQAANGNFYGTTVYGGAPNPCPGIDGCGTIFQITPSGTLTTLHDFQGADGAFPSSLILATDGNFYGTTLIGGNNGCFDPPINGCGTIFKITPSGTLTTLHTFQGIDGGLPMGMIQATDGNFYGTTRIGSDMCFSGCGTIFIITPSGTLTTLYQFRVSDGQNPSGTLVQATDGNFYGTSSPVSQNGDDCLNNGCGTIFQITPAGTFTTLHSFEGPDGMYPLGGLMQATNGTLYGTTSTGPMIVVGCNGFGCGTVYSLSMNLGPFVTTVPTSGKAGRGVRILGTDLTDATHVTFNGRKAKFTVVSPTEITTTVPKHATTGTVNVTTPSGTLSSNVVFRVP